MLLFLILIIDFFTGSVYHCYQDLRAEAITIFVAEIDLLKVELKKSNFFINKFSLLN
jgi:hypothetical protein